MKTIKHKTLAVLGGNGMLGSDLLSYFLKKYKVTSITKQNYSEHVGKSFDIFVNANGNSKRWWANQNPCEDFLASTNSVIKSIFDFPAKTYIYISSVDVYSRHDQPKYTLESSTIVPEKLEPYGLHKYLSEQIVKKYTNQFLILRPSAILGSSLKKGPVFDVINGKSLFITKNSKLQFITGFEIAKVIDLLLKKKITGNVINVGGIGSIYLSKLNKIFNKEIKTSPEARVQKYEMNVNKLKSLYPSLKSSEEYLQEYCANI